MSMKACEFLNNNTRFHNECKARYFCQHHGYGRNEAGHSYHECSREGNEFTSEETFVFVIGHFIEQQLDECFDTTQEELDECFDTTQEELDDEDDTEYWNQRTDHWFLESARRSLGIV